MTALQSDIQSLAEELQPLVMRATAPLHDAAVVHAPDASSAFLRQAEWSGGFVLSADPDCTVSFGENPPSIKFSLNLGFVLFFKNLARTLLSRMNFVSEAESEPACADAATTTPSNKETIDFARLVAEAFWNQQIVPDTQMPSLPLNPMTEAMWNLIVILGIRFSIAHEIAHVLLCQSKTPSTHILEGVARAREILTRSGANTQSIDKRSIDWGTEFAADRIGLAIACAATSATEGKELSAFQHCAAWVFFHCCEILWRYHLATRGDAVDRLGSHPPFHIRLLDLQREYPFRNAYLDMAGAFQKVTDIIIQGLCETSPVLKALGDVDFQNAVRLHGKAKFILNTGGDAREAIAKADAALHLFENAGNLDDVSECMLTRARLLKMLARYRDSARAYFFAYLLFSRRAGSENAAGLVGKELQDMVNDRPMPEREFIANAVRDAAIEAGVTVQRVGQPT